MDNSPTNAAETNSRVPHFSRVRAVGPVGLTTKLRLISSIFLGVLLLLGAGDNSRRIDRLGHQMMCVCGCNQILLECNHVGC